MTRGDAARPAARMDRDDDRSAHGDRRRRRAPRPRGHGPPVRGGDRSPSRRAPSGAPDRASRRGPERLRLEDLSIDYGAKPAVKSRLAVDPPGRGARADRPVGLRQDDAAAHAQPPHRADAERRPRAGASCSTARTSTSSTRHDAARAASRWSSSSRTRSRCRSSTTSPSRCASSRASGPRRRELEPLVVDALQARRALRRGPRRPRPPGAAPLRRPAAAAVHRARDRAAAGGAADGRAVLARSTRSRRTRSRS